MYNKEKNHVNSLADFHFFGKLRIFFKSLKIRPGKGLLYMFIKKYCIIYLLLFYFTFDICRNFGKKTS